MREAIRSASAVFVALSKNLPHNIRDDGRQVPRQTIDLEVDAFDLPVQAVYLVLQAIEFVLQAIHPGLDGGQIITVVPALIEDMTGHQFLALDLALDQIDAHRECMNSSLVTDPAMAACSPDPSEASLAHVVTSTSTRGHRAGRASPHPGHARASRLPERPASTSSSPAAAT